MPTPGTCRPVDIEGVPAYFSRVTHIRQVGSPGRGCPVRLHATTPPFGREVFRWSKLIQLYRLAAKCAGRVTLTCPSSSKMHGRLGQAAPWARPSPPIEREHPGDRAVAACRPRRSEAPDRVHAQVAFQRSVAEDESDPDSEFLMFPTVLPIQPAAAADGDEPQPDSGSHGGPASENRDSTAHDPSLMPVAMHERHVALSFTADRTHSTMRGTPSPISQSWPAKSPSVPRRRAHSTQPSSKTESWSRSGKSD